MLEPRELVERIAAYIARYVAFPVQPTGQSLVCALWAIHTWVYERFAATPYLCVTADGRGCGKTVLLEVLQPIVRYAPDILATLRPLGIARLIEASDGRCTILIDESEKLSQTAAQDARSIMTTGYASGGTHLISVGEKFKRFRTYAPKAFALIGDPNDVIRDRSIYAWLTHGTPERSWRMNKHAATQEGENLAAELLRGIPVPTLIPPPFLCEREQEIWTPIYSIAHAMRLTREQMALLHRAMADQHALRQEPLRSYHDFADDENEKAARQSRQCLADLVSVLREGERNIGSADAVERMRAIDAGPWRMFQRTGLDELKLATLLGPFELSPASVQIGSGRRNRKICQGYKVAAIRAAFEEIDV